jgi:hypothetical protein
MVARTLQSSLRLPTSLKLRRAGPTSPKLRRKSRRTGLWTHPRAGFRMSPGSRQAGVSLVELTVALCLLMGVAQFGLQTLTSAWMQQNWSVKQSMTDAYAGIETAYAQRWTFSTIPSTDVESAPDVTKTTPYTLWPVYPNSSQTQVTVGRLPQIARTPLVTAQVIRTCKQPFTDPNTGAPSFQDPITGATAYLLESYVIYQDGQRKYCKVSKVYRSE